jgi:hypothetical protein
VVGLAAGLVGSCFRTKCFKTRFKTVSKRISRLSRCGDEAVGNHVRIQALLLPATWSPEVASDSAFEAAPYSAR